MGRKITIDIVKDELSLISPDIDIVDDAYRGCDKPLKCKCKNCDKIWYPIWDNLKQGKGCMDCRRKKGNKERRMTIEEIKRRAEKISFNLKILEDKYLNENSLMKCVCLVCHKRFLLSWRSIRNGVNCKECEKERYFSGRRHSLEVIFKTISREKIPVKYVGGEYKNAHSELEFECTECGMAFKKTWNNIKYLSQHCPSCGIKKRSGENHPHYNHDLTPEERGKDRLTLYGNRYMKWCREVHEKHGFRCKVCSTKENIIAHHLYSYSTHKHLRLEVLNGVTLCRKHHKDFHSKYGYKNNTKEQFDEYIKRIFK